jgi:hypothetical protein
MEPTLAIPEDEREIYLDQWRLNVETELKKYENLDLFIEGAHCQSIVSFRIKSTHSDQQWFNKADMTTIFKSMTLDLSSTFPDSPVASKKCQIGQPVVIAEGQAVLRIALGADDLRNFVKDPESVK